MRSLQLERSAIGHDLWDKTMKAMIIECLKVLKWGPPLPIPSPMLDEKEGASPLVGVHFEVTLVKEMRSSLQLERSAIGHDLWDKTMKAMIIECLKVLKWGPLLPIPSPM